MSISKGFRYKDEKGKVTDYEYGVNGSNVTQDANHRLVTDEEKKKWNGKADPEDIPSGSAASYSVANNDTTTQAGFVADARIVKQHGDEIDQLSSEFQAWFGVTEDGQRGWKEQGADTVIPFSRATKVLAMFHASTSGITRYTAEKKIFGLTMVTEDARESYTVLKVNGEDQPVKDIAQISSTYVSGYQTYDITLNPGDEVAVTNRGGGGSDIVLLSGIVQSANQ